MSAEQRVISDKAQPNYAGWRGELLAKLALSRMPDWIVVANHALQLPSGQSLECDFFVMSPKGVKFVVELKGFSSMKERIRDLLTISLLRWRLDRHVIERALLTKRALHLPVVLFLFDADTGHGRYLRLDSGELLTQASARLVTVRLPVKNTITAQSLQCLETQLLSEAQKRRGKQTA